MLLDVRDVVRKQSGDNYVHVTYDVTISCSEDASADADTLYGEIKYHQFDNTWELFLSYVPDPKSNSDYVCGELFEGHEIYDALIEYCGRNARITVDKSKVF